jgi:hypothetical protein
MESINQDLKKYAGSSNKEKKIWLQKKYPN